MSARERNRLEVLSRVRAGEVSLAKAAELLSISVRQAWRLKRRYVREGDGGLVHRLRGKPGNRRTDAALRRAVLKLYRGKYAGFGPTLAWEYLAKDETFVALNVELPSHDTLWRWLRAEGLLERRRRRSGHRRRRERREHPGELVQMDGSWHDWLEGRGPWCCLMVMIDDATGRVHARFYEKETLEAAFDVFERYARLHGLPRALYVDRAGMYRVQDEDGKRTLTQFGRAMKELDVELICANSPQAKGRVERMNGTLQDRLVKEMRLREINTMAQANALLEKGPFLAEFNGKFQVAPAQAADVHRAATETMTLQETLCERQERAVGRDGCVQWRGRLLQLDERHAALDLARSGRRVQVIEKRDKTLLVRYQRRELSWQETSARPKRPRAAKKPVVNNKQWKPPASHPWKKGLAGVSRRQGLVGCASSALAAGQKG
jgi:hypothetical protein